MTVKEATWRPLLNKLVSTLIGNGDLRSPEWIAAFRTIPRHVFVPRFIITENGRSRVLSEEDPAGHDEWLMAAYANEALVTQQRPHPDGYRTVDGELLRIPTSSSSAPTLMARMVELLAVEDGHRVLEIGTGTGYHAALLSHRLGSANVVSIDIDPDLVAAAGEQLASLGYSPTLVRGDGTTGAPECGPYDRIIATAGVPDIPAAWIDQLAPNGRILANLRGELTVNTLCLLTKQGDDNKVTGPILSANGGFMWLRTELDNPQRAHQSVAPSSRARPAISSTRVDPTILLVDEEFRFLLQLQLFGIESCYRTAITIDTGREWEAVVVCTSDGSRAEAFVEPGPDGRHLVAQYGRRRLWDTVEATELLRRELNPIPPTRFGVTARESDQYVWLDADNGGYRWPLPLV